MIIAAMLALAVGTYLLRMSGPVLRTRVTFPASVEKLLDTSAVVLLTSLVAVTALTEGSGPADVARPVGVLVGGVLAWRKAPFMVAVLAAAATTALLRLL
ncbi:AzlD domain-containing protein [Actinomadura rupiterrae]|uniref:AzlD domain-containing protein n=1 Tax=Actinomadura rupiterrae TaxID=559627 RepID=UPI0020A548D2|nr:AzlD domain-containing protein [Actinomadura rupiterrae]MCP2340737.1 branched-subunit amino acid transport protein [Actinomadura rupiterrae]